MNAILDVVRLLLSLRLRAGEQTSIITVVLDTSAPGMHETPRPPVEHDAPLSGALSQVFVEVSAVLGQATVRMRQLLDLQAGEVLLLDTAVDAAIPLLVEGTAKFVGKPILARGSLGLEICAPPKE